jgi:hypothetical protein
MSNKSLVDHLQTHTCLPFPAGPIVPREYSAARHNDEFGPKASERAAAALILMRSDHERTQTRDNPKSPLPGLMRDSFVEFHTRHAEMGLFDENSPVEDQLLTALVPLRGGGQEKAAVEEFLRRFGQRRTKPANSKDKKAPGEPVAERQANENAINSRNVPAERLPYSAPRYGCTCGGSRATAARLQGLTSPVSPPTPSNSDTYVQAVLNIEDGDWVLLSLLFLKQFHSHLAWAPAESRMEKAQPFYKVMLQQLEHLARRGYAVAWAGTAAGLQQCLPRLGPYLAPPGRAVKLPAATAAPECFRPDRLADRRTSLEQVCVLLAGHGQLAAMALDVDALALEVAARMTDPTTAQKIGLNHIALGYLTNPYGKRASDLKKAAEQAAQGLKPAGLNMSVDFALFDFQPKVKRLWSYVDWMTCHGLDALSNGTPR